MPAEIGAEGLISTPSQQCAAVPASHTSSQARFASVRWRSWRASPTPPASTLLALRFGIAAAILFAIALARGDAWPRGKTLATLVAPGALGYGGQAVTFFTPLPLPPAGLGALLLYVYPALVAVLSGLRLPARLSCPEPG